MLTNLAALRIEYWPIERLVEYPRNPRKKDAAVDQMVASILEFGFAIPVLARSSGEVIDGHLRAKAARKMGSWPGGDTARVPVIPCDAWTEAQVKAFRLMMNRSVTWADWDDDLLGLELLDLKNLDFDWGLPASMNRNSFSCSPRRTQPMDCATKTPRRRRPRYRPRSWGTYGYSDATGYCAVILPIRKLSLASWVP
jgi:hypothetical protein